MSVASIPHYLKISSLSVEQFMGLLHLAKELKEERKRLGQNAPILAGKSLALIFQKPSLRTRVSFEMGMVQLGGYALYLSAEEIGLGKRESVADIARVLSGYVDGIMARVYDHEHVVGLAEWSTVPVINGLSDSYHPCQALTDIFTIWEHVGQLAGVSIAYVGDGANNVAESLLAAAGKVGMSVRIVAPVGYQPPEESIANSDADIVVTDDLDGVIGADIIYTDVWTSMGQEAEREKRHKALGNYQLNEDLIAHTRNPDVKVMHCLPAHRSEEITDAVADGFNSLLFPQAHNRLHAQKALLAHMLGGITLV